jgi:maltooligosyltrehalose trehalohydrolase
VPPRVDAPSREALVWWDYYRALLRLRREVLMPGLAGAVSLGAHAIGDYAVSAKWRLGDGRVLAIHSNFAREDVQVPPLAADAQLLFESSTDAARSAMHGILRAGSTVVVLDTEQA